MKKDRKSNSFSKVYTLVRKIPRGKVTTYGRIAKRLRMIPRVIGWALHANKDRGVPCHRVVDRNGRLAPNFAFGGDKEQRLLLEKEGVTFKDAKHVDLKKCGIIS